MSVGCAYFWLVLTIWAIIEREREREREDLMVVKLNININFVPKKKFPRPSASLFQLHGLNNLF
jgi:hypothetical protein